MTPEQATFLLNEVYLPQAQREQKTTRRVIEAIPCDDCGYKPDEKAKSALDLAWHIASSECFFMNGVAAGQFAPGSGATPDSVKTPADVLKWYDENFAQATSKLAAAKGEDLVRSIDFFGVFNHAGIAYLGLMLSHSAHHRGQLSSYLRPMGSKVPSIYGPSGDEPLPTPAKATA
jgi:uncharacterized damage-inducible protein DinB